MPRARFAPASSKSPVDSPASGCTLHTPMKYRSARTCRIASTVAEPTPVPVLGEWLALPVVRAAGSHTVGDAVYDAVFHPHCERLLSHCDALLRVGGASEGADRMVAAARRRGLLVFHDMAEIGYVQP